MARKPKLKVMSEITETIETEQPEVQEAAAEVAQPITTEDFISLIGKRVVIDNTVVPPYEDELEYVGAEHIITKHGARIPFWQVKAAQ
jgi:hypothetical protein